MWKAGLATHCGEQVSNKGQSLTRRLGEEGVPHRRNSLCKGSEAPNTLMHPQSGKSDFILLARKGTTEGHDQIHRLKGFLWLLRL